MPVEQIEPHTALVVIDLQKGITALPTITPSDAIVTQAARLASAFRERGMPVVLVRTMYSPDEADMLRPRSDAPAPAITRSADFADLRPELAQAPNDLIITKHQWDAFFGTELDLQLRRRQITGIVMTGISTSIGVESTARQAYSLGYQLTFATDAMSDLVQTAHDNSLRTIFPRMGQLATTEAILAALPAKG
ncbi:MAG TPA: isochorismatase family protein [Ktedonobacterales bacterium]